MKPINLTRAGAWIATVAAGWSLNLRWGVDEMVRNGAPPQFERHVVGAALLAAIAALALAFAGPARPARRRTAAIALLFATGSHAIAWWVRSLSTSTGQPHLVEGSGWRWLIVGSALSMLCCAAALALPPGRARANAKRR